MSLKSVIVTASRLVLLVFFVVLIAVFAFDQYDYVRDMVRFICVSCLGLGE